jgi:hypothetical protein
MEPNVYGSYSKLLTSLVFRDSSLVYTVTIANSKGVVYSAELEPGKLFPIYLVKVCGYPIYYFCTI